jgi:hypothetical protein
VEIKIAYLSYEFMFKPTDVVDVKPTKIWFRIIILKPLIILLLSIIPFIGLINGSGFFAVGDYVLPLFPDREVARCISLWDESFLMGHLTTPIPLANLPQYVLYYVIYVFLGFENTSRALFPIVFIIAGFSIYSLSRYFVKSYIPNIASVVLYIYNPWVIDMVLSGHISLLIAYALTPLMLLLYFKGVDENSLKQILESSLLLALIISISYHTAPLVIPLILMYPAKWLRSGLRRYRLALITIVLAILLNSYWISTFPTASKYISSSVSLSDVENLSVESNIVNVLRLHGYFWSGWWNIFNSRLPPILRGLWWFLSFLPLTTLLLSFRRVKALIIIAFIYSILAVGLNWPFHSINKFLYENIPFYTIYRDPNKFVSVMCLTYSIATSYTIDWILKTRFRSIAVAIVILLLLNSWPLLTGNLCGYLQPFNLPRDYVDVDAWLQDREGGFRVLWLPPVETGAEFSWRPRMEGLWGILDPLRYSVFSKPNVGFTHVSEWFGGVRDTIWFLHFLHNQIYRKGLSDLIPILNMLNVKYIVFRRDITGASCTNVVMGREEFSRVEDDLNRTFKLVQEFGYLRIYENPYVNPREFIATNSSLVVVGCLEALIYTPSIDRAAVFMIEDLNMDELETIMNISNVTFIFLNTNITDAAIHLSSDVYNPLSFSLDGWLPVTWEWGRESLNEIASRGYIRGGIIYSEKVNSTAVAKLNVKDGGVYQLWVKAWLSPNPSSLEVYLDNSLLTDLNLYSSTSSFKYIPLKTVYLPSGSHIIKISLKQGEAILGDLALSKLEKINQTIAKLEEALSSPRVKTINIHIPTPSRHEEQLAVSSYGEVELQTQIYKSGTYIINIKTNGTASSVKVDFNNTIYDAEINNTYVKSIVKAEKGVSKVKIYVEGNITISHVTVMECSGMEIGEIKELIATKKSPLEYNVKNIDKGIIVFKQSYSPLWLAYSRETYKPIQSIIFNAYPAQEEITIKLKIGEAYIAGIITSTTTLTAIIAIIIKQYINQTHQLTIRNRGKNVSMNQ